MCAPAVKTTPITFFTADKATAVSFLLFSRARCRFEHHLRLTNNPPPLPTANDALYCTQKHAEPGSTPPPLLCDRYQPCHFTKHQLPT